MWICPETGTLCLLLWSLVTGMGVGVIAGLLGVGGGIVIVPTLLLLFHLHGVDTTIATQLAVGTSLATIVVTNAAATYHHHRLGAVRWKLAWRYTPGMLIGAWCGAFLAASLSGPLLQRLFGLFELLIAWRMVHGERTPCRDIPPSSRHEALMGWGIGTVSALFGIGGGTLSVPALTLYSGLPIRQAVATASAMGVVIALFGAAGFIQTGWNHPLLPQPTLGFVALIPFAAIAGATLFSTRLGVHLAHTLDPGMLRRLFAGLLAGVGMLLVVKSW